MKMPKHSLRKVVSFLNNKDEDGGFWLPNIQRRFVWDEEQICRLFDSILREYPISTLLVWKTRSEIRHRKFIDNFSEDLHLSQYFVPENSNRKCLVLDGQQRLQSLFIGLCGSYNGKELYFNMLSGENAAPDDVMYKFEFYPNASFPWIKFKELVFCEMDTFSAAMNIIENAEKELSDDEKRKINRHVSIVFKAFHSDDGISYQELDSTENSTLYTDDDVVEIFIRANSGGTRLEKSDLLFALLKSSWDDANERMEELQEELTKIGFDVSQDFVIKACLTILDQGARYEVFKLRKPDVRKQIESKWSEISCVFKDVFDFIRGRTYIHCQKALTSQIVLIPLLYSRFHFPDNWKKAKGIDDYLLRCLFSSAFTGQPDQLVDNCVSKIKISKGFDAASLFEVIQSFGKTVEITRENFWAIGYNSKIIHLLFNIWYKNFDYTPAYINNYPQVDHVFPQSELRKIKEINPATKRQVIKYRKEERDQLANCMLLTQEENGAGGKSNITPDKWFSGKSDGYLEMHLIPKDPSLWRLERFDEFIEERKKLIERKFAYLFAKKLKV